MYGPEILQRMLYVRQWSPVIFFITSVSHLIDSLLQITPKNVLICYHLTPDLRLK